MYGKPTYLRESETETENEEYMTFLAKDEGRKDKDFQDKNSSVIRTLPCLVCVGHRKLLLMINLMGRPLI